MNSVKNLTGQPETLRVGGSTYLVHPLEINDFGKLQAWVDSQFPDPFSIVREQMDSGRFSSTQQQYMLKLAMDKAVAGKPKIGTPEADSLIASPAGIKEVLFLSISKGDPAFTRERMEEIYARMVEDEVAKLQSATNLDMVAHDPKDGKPTLTPSGSATSRRSRRGKAASTGGSSTTRR